MCCAYRMRACANNEVRHQSARAAHLEFLVSIDSRVVGIELADLIVRILRSKELIEALIQETLRSAIGTGRATAASAIAHAHHGEV